MADPYAVRLLKEAEHVVDFRRWSGQPVDPVLQAAIVTARDVNPPIRTAAPFKVIEERLALRENYVPFGTLQKLMNGWDPYHPTRRSRAGMFVMIAIAMLLVITTATATYTYKRGVTILQELEALAPIAVRKDFGQYIREMHQAEMQANRALPIPAEAPDQAQARAAQFDLARTVYFDNEAELADLGGRLLEAGSSFQKFMVERPSPVPLYDPVRCWVRKLWGGPEEPGFVVPGQFDYGAQRQHFLCSRGAAAGGDEGGDGQGTNGGPAPSAEEELVGADQADPGRQEPPAAGLPAGAADPPSAATPTATRPLDLAAVIVAGDVDVPAESASADDPVAEAAAAAYAAYPEGVESVPECVARVVAGAQGTGGGEVEGEDAEAEFVLVDWQHYTSEIDRFVEVLRCRRVIVMSMETYPNIPNQLAQLRITLTPMATLILPALYGAAGAILAMMRLAVRPLNPNPTSSEFALRLAFGVVAGVVLVWFVTPESQLESQMTAFGLSLFGLAFLVGFSLDLFFSIFDRLLGLSSEAARRFNEPSAGTVRANGVG